MRQPAHRQPRVMGLAHFDQAVERGDQGQLAHRPLRSDPGGHAGAQAAPDHADVAIRVAAPDLVVYHQRVGQQRLLARAAVAGAVTAVGDQVDAAVGEPFPEAFAPGFDPFGVAAEVDQGVAPARVHLPAAQHDLAGTDLQIGGSGLHPGEGGEVHRIVLAGEQQQAQRGIGQHRQHHQRQHDHAQGRTPARRGGCGRLGLRLQVIDHLHPHRLPNRGQCADRPPGSASTAR